MATEIASMYIFEHGVDEYKRNYRNGWNYSRKGRSLDKADDRGYTSDHAWMDGYLDNATGREMWHMLNCTGCSEHETNATAHSNYVSVVIDNEHTEMHVDDPFFSILFPDWKH